MNILYTLILWACVITGFVLVAISGQLYGLALMMVGIAMAVTRVRREFRARMDALQGEDDEQD
jgi:mannose/fructose/N-acetylgalactosamine-specific phosphotransferase system component IIC